MSKSWPTRGVAVLAIAVASLAPACAAKKVAAPLLPTRTSPEKFAAAANGICATVNAQVKALPQPASLAEVAAMDYKLVPIYQSEATALRGLTRPDVDTTRVTDMLNHLDQAVVQLRRSGVSASSNDLAAAIKAYLFSRSEVDEARTAANAFGLAECAKSV